MEAQQICKDCRQPLPGDAPEGLCPQCLARVGLGTEPAATSAETTPTKLIATITVRPFTLGDSSEPVSTLTVDPAVPARLRYFGDYELQQEIARGGMGVVWKARQSSLNRPVAIKMILAGKLASDSQVQRFYREAEAAANLQHPNIVAIHEIGEHDGQHYYSMDYVEGRNLGAVVQENGPLPPGRAAECLKTIAEAVHFAHERGTLHRDLKPQNVLIDAAGRPRITDFGLAKIIERDDSLTQSGAAMGSPSYMPPEQAAGHLEHVGAHSDVYALGAILYELLTGRPPFRAETAVATMRQVMESNPVAPHKLNPAVPPDLETICLKCLEKNSARRYSSARALSEDLGRFLNHESIQALPVSAVRKLESWLGRHPWTLTALVSLAAMFLAGMLYWQYERLKFFQNQLVTTGPALQHPGLRGQQLRAWDNVRAVVSIAVSALLIFQQYARGRLGRRDISTRPAVWEPVPPLGHKMRIVCGLMSVAACGCMALYLAKLIQVSVWESTPKWSEWLSAYAIFSLSLSILFWVVRDYRKFVYGVPSRSLSAEQSQSMRQAIFAGDISGATRLYRQAVSEAGLPEANDYVRKLATELRAKHPEEFAAPLKWWDLNWRLLGVCVLVEFSVFTGYWMLTPPVASSAWWLAAAAGFLLGAGALFSVRLKPRWRAPAMVACTALAALTMPWFAHDAFGGGLAFGACMVLSGFTRKHGKPAPSDKQVE